MTSERVQRQIERFLDEAEAAMALSDWGRALDRARNALALDPANADGLSYVAAAERRLTETSPVTEASRATAPSSSAVVPTAFANGRYEVRRFLGEGGKKKVYLAHDTLLDRDIAFALIKTEGLVAGRQRISREAQAMGCLWSHPHIVTVFDIGEETALPGDSVYLPLASGRHAKEALGGSVGRTLVEGAPVFPPWPRYSTRRYC